MESLFFSSRTEIFLGKRNFLKGRTKFPNGIAEFRTEGFYPPVPGYSTQYLPVQMANIQSLPSHDAFLETTRHFDSILPHEVRRRVYSGLQFFLRLIVMEGFNLNAILRGLKRVKRKKIISETPPDS